LKRKKRQKLFLHVYHYEACQKPLHALVAAGPARPRPCKII